MHVCKHVCARVLSLSLSLCHVFSLSLSLSLFLCLMLLHGGVVLTQCYAAYGSRAMPESLDQYLAPWLVRTGWGAKNGVYSRTAFRWFIGNESRPYSTPGMFIVGIQRRDLKLDLQETPQPKPKPKPTPQIQRSSRSRSPAPCPVRLGGHASRAILLAATKAAADDCRRG